MPNTTNDSTSYDMMIVGCGPVGASMANHLRLLGYRVAIFDRDKEIFSCPRAMAYDDETLRILDTIGVLERIQEEGHIYQSDAQTVTPDGKILMEVNKDRMGDAVNGLHGHYFLSVIDQPSLEKLLRDDFAKGDNPIATYLGYEVLNVTGDGDVATLKAKNLDTDEDVEFNAAYIIGCDGLSSHVRRSMNVGRIDLEYSEDYLVVDAIVDDREYFEREMPQGGRYRFDAKRSGITAKGLHGHVRLELFRHPEHMPLGFDENEDFTETARNLIISEGFDPDKLRVIRTAPYSFYASTPEKWRKGRLLLAGDAAHVTPPWAGQGLNMGMRDCANLSFKLDLVMKDQAPDSIIDTYEQERQPSSLGTIKGAVMVGKNMTAEKNLQATLRDFMMFLARHNKFMNRLMVTSGVSKPPYEEGFLGNNHKLSGKPMLQPRLIGADGDEVLMDKLIGMKFALVSTVDAEGPHVDKFVNELGGIVLNINNEIQDGSDGTLTSFMKKNNISTLIMRPDRYIFDAGNDPEKLCKSLFNFLN